MGITGEDFNQATFGITGPNDGYIFMQAPETFTETVTNKALTSNVATLTVGANDFRVGMPVTVTGVDATFNGSYTITAKTSTTFSYAKTAADVPSEEVHKEVPTAPAVEQTPTNVEQTPVKTETISNMYQDNTNDDDFFDDFFSDD